MIEFLPFVELKLFPVYPKLVAFDFLFASFQVAVDVELHEVADQDQCVGSLQDKHL